MIKFQLMSRSYWVTKVAELTRDKYMVANDSYVMYHVKSHVRLVYIHTRARARRERDARASYIIYFTIEFSRTRVYNSYPHSNSIRVHHSKFVFANRLAFKSYKLIETARSSINCIIRGIQYFTFFI